MEYKIAGFVTLLAVSNFLFAIAEPIPPLDALLPKAHVEIDYANITGRISGNIREFLGALKYTMAYRPTGLDISLTVIPGIPFATAGRFEHPQLYSEQLGDFDGSNYGPICPQHSTGSILTLNSSRSLVLDQTGTAIGPVVGALADTALNFIGRTRSEDCLSINVQSPVGTTKRDKLPVVIWIHGGAFEIGGPFTALGEADVVRGTAPNYNIGGLVRTSVDLGQPIIGVSANYRLNAFGFSAGEEMEVAGLLNLGLEDQRVAMRWVQRHISDFGGDVC
jgi:acetylcholinesterase